MNRVELESLVAERTGQPKNVVSSILSSMLDAWTETLRDGGEIKIVGFGVFGVRERSARKGKNPRTGEPIEVPASRKVVFRTGKSLLRALEP
jgi:nucleoid DNA-binding protein